MSRPEIVTIDPTTSADEAVGIVRRDGCLVVRGLADAGAMDAVAAELGADIARTPRGGGEFVGRETKRTHTVLPNSPTAGTLALHPVVAALNEAFLKPFCANYQLSSSVVISIGEGETAQELHRDDLVYPFSHPREQQSVTTFIWALTDFTAENGATLVVPGSHRWDDERRPSLDEAATAVMPRGSLLCLLGSTYHGGGANRSASDRAGLLFGYCLGWLRQEQNQYLAVPPAVAKSLPEPLQRLIGYAVHEPFLGWHDLQDPIVVLRGYEDSSAGAQDLIPDGQSNAVQADRVRRS